MGGIQGTLLRVIAYRCPERHESDFTCHTDVLVGCQSGTEDFILPIGGLLWILVEHGLCRITQRSPQRILPKSSFTEFIRPHDLHPFVRVFDSKRTCIIYLDTVLRTFLGGDDDYPVRCTRTIDSSGTGILQHSKGFNVIRIDGCQGIGCTRSRIIGYRNPVNYNQRIVTGIQGSATTNADTASRSRLTVACRYIQTRHFPLNQFLGRSYRSLVHVFGFNGHDRAAQVVFLDRAITDDHQFFQLLRIVTQRDVHDRLGRQFLCLITNE